MPHTGSRYAGGVAACKTQWYHKDPRRSWAPFNGANALNRTPLCISQWGLEPCCTDCLFASQLLCSYARAHSHALAPSCPTCAVVPPPHLGRRREVAQVHWPQVLLHATVPRAPRRPPPRSRAPCRCGTPQSWINKVAHIAARVALERGGGAHGGGICGGGTMCWVGSGVDG